MQTHKAQLIDAGELSQLFDLYRQFYRQPTNLADSERFVTERLKNSDSIFFITTTNTGEGMGFTQLYPSFSSVAMRRVWILNDLYVHENYRQKGVATALINSAKDYAVATNAFALKLATAKNNHQAKALYKKIGFKQITEFDYYTLVAR